MFTRKQTHLVVLNDLDKAHTALQEALETAGHEEAPGLRRALDIVESIAATGDPRLCWAREVLAAKGIDPREKEVHAVKALREEVPGMQLVAAVQLVRECQA